MSILQTLAEALAPWQHAFAASKTLSIGVVFAHLGSLLFGGGFAVAADRATLRAFRATADEQRRVLDELEAVHRPVLIALACSFISGVMLVTSEIETFWSSPIYWVKMALIALLLVNGAVLRRSERAARLAADSNDSTRSAQLWSRLRFTSWASALLWLSVVLAGTVLVSAA